MTNKIKHQLSRRRSRGFVIRASFNHVYDNCQATHGLQIRASGGASPFCGSAHPPPDKRVAVQ